MPASVTLVRHGETAWSLTGQHTGRTDIPLTEEGERKARALRDRFKGVTFDRVFTSPLQRAARTCALAGFGEPAKAIPTFSNGTTATTKVGPRRRSSASAPGGSCSATDARTANSRPTSAMRADRVIARLRAAG